MDIKIDNKGNTICELFVDSSGSLCTFGLRRGGDFFTTSVESDSMMNERFLPLMDSFFQKTDISLDELERISVVVGPGSFTGIRIGIASVLGLSKAFMAKNKKIDLKGISSLDAAAIISGRQEINIAARLKGDEFVAKKYDFNNSVFSEYEIVKLKDIENDHIFINSGPLSNEKLKNLATSINSKQFELFLVELSPLYMRKSEAEIGFDQKSHA